MIKNMNRNIKGFTLLELLVVIGIISILVTMGFSSYSTAQKKARDAKRKGDMKAIQNSLEQYYAICGFQYPTPAGNTFTSVTCLSPTNAIMPTVPVDPLADPYVCDGADCTATGYKLCAPLLEAEPTPPGGYCLTNQQ
jgi:prepilin-type N-terminal cleavage/methylation domain-containing protein